MTVIIVLFILLVSIISIKYRNKLNIKTVVIGLILMTIFIIVFILIICLYSWISVLNE
jgi:hypothetical protein